MKKKIGPLCVLVLASVFATSLFLPVTWLSSQVDRSSHGGRVSVLDFGAIGDGVKDDRAAIQAAIDAGDEIHFPDVPHYYRIVGSLQIGGSKQTGGKRLIGHRPCRGGGAFQGKVSLIQGSGSVTLLVAKGTTFQNRAIELVGLSASNHDHPVLDLMSGVDAMIDNCLLRSLRNTDAAVRIRESYNVTIRESTIGCSGGGFAITAYQQCNKLRIQNCRLGGGDLGGAVHVEQSANVQLEGNVVELGVYGMVVASGIRLDQPQLGNVEGAGACHALRISSNYFENLQHPIVVGSAMNLRDNSSQAVFGAVIECNSVGTYGFDFPLLTIGRLKAGVISGNSFWRKADGKSATIQATFAQDSNPSHPISCVIEANNVTSGNGPFIVTDDVKVKGVAFSDLMMTDNRVSPP